MRVIICGGRNYDDKATVEQVLGIFSSGYTLVHGACTGADSLAVEVWAYWHGAIEPHPADWERHGKAAGPLRNEEMAKLGADVCIAFPGGRGTADMVKRATAHGIPTLRVVP